MIVSCSEATSFGAAGRVRGPGAAVADAVVVAEGSLTALDVAVGFLPFMTSLLFAFGCCDAGVARPSKKLPKAGLLLEAFDVTDGGGS